MKTKQFIKNMMARAAMTLLMLITMTQGTWATDFITDVMLIGGTKTEVNNLKSTYQNQGWTVIDYDLSKGCGSSSDYIYLLYKTASNDTCDAGAFITDLYISTTKGNPGTNTPTIHNREYYLVPYDGGDYFKSVKGNLNSHASGTDLHLYYTKDTDEDYCTTGFTAITFNSEKTDAVCEDSTTTACDLNKGTGGTHIYMHPTTAMKGWTIHKDYYGDQCYITGYEGKKANRTEITIPLTIDGAKVLNFDMTFSGFTNLEKMTFPKGTIIDEMPSMQGCTKFKMVKACPPDNPSIATNIFPSSITNIPPYAFAGTAIVYLYLPCVTSVEDHAFEGCNSLKILLFYKSADIGYGAFSNISSNCQISYTGPLSKWEPYMYQYSPNLVCGDWNNDWFCGWCGGSKADDNNWLYWTMVKTETINNQEYGRLTISCSNDGWTTYPDKQVIKTHNWRNYSRSISVKSLTLEHVHALGTEEFKDFGDLESVELNYDLTGIGASCFENCGNLPSITIPASVKSIGDKAFKGCTNLSDIYFDGTETQWGQVTKGANWKPDATKVHWHCTVTFNNNGHGATPSAQANLWSNESTATEPNAPTASGYVFTGWYTDAACTTKWEFNTPVSHDMTLYAGWEALLQLADNTANNLSTYDGKLCRVTLKDRTLYTDGDWSTLCLPFAVSNLTGTALAGFTVKELDTETEYGGHVTGFDKGTLYLNFKDATSIEAGKPYLVRKEDMTATSATPAYSPIEGTSGSNWNQGYANLIDGSTGGNMWRTSISEGHTPYCEFHTDQPFYVSGYKLTTGNQNAIGDPTVWTLKAKLNADDEWTVIDSRNVSANASDALPSGRTKGKSYTVQHPGTYQYFHFEVLQTGGSFMCLSELALQCYNFEPVNVENPTFTGVTLNSAAPTAVTSSDGAVSFMGGYSPVSLAANDRTNLYLGSGNTLCYPNANLTIGSCRAYLHLLTNTSLGDVNGDGAINITDVIFMVNHILGQNNDDFIIANADINQSGGIDISDVVLLVNKILSPDSSNKVTTVVSNVDITYDSSGSGSAR